MEVTFLGVRCAVAFSKYGNGNEGTAIRLYDAEEGDPMATATVNLPPLLPFRVNGVEIVAIKNYSENTGILEVLQKAGIVGAVLRYEQCGFARVPLVPLLVSPETV